MAGARRSCLTIRFVPRGATPRFAVVRDGSFQCGSQGCTEKMLFLAAQRQYTFPVGQSKSADCAISGLRSRSDRGCVKTWVNFELGGRVTPPHHERIAYSAI